MEAHVAQGWSRPRIVVPSIVVGVLVVLLSAGIIYKNKKDSGAKDGKSLAAAAGGSAAAGAKNGKKNGETEKAPVPVSVAAAAVAPVSSYISATTSFSGR